MKAANERRGILCSLEIWCNIDFLANEARKAIENASKLQQSEAQRKKYVHSLGTSLTFSLEKLQKEEEEKEKKKLEEEKRRRELLKNEMLLMSSKSMLQTLALAHA